jgi:hypothetical protein
VINDYAAGIGNSPDGRPFLERRSARSRSRRARRSRSSASIVALAAAREGSPWAPLDAL